MRRSSLAVDAGLFLIIVAVPLAWTKLFVAEFTLAKLLILNVALALAAAGAVALPAAIAGGSTALDLPLGAGLIVLCLSAAVSADPWTSLRGRYDSYAYGVWGLAMTAAALQLAARGARGREDRVLRWLGWSAAGVGAYAILQKLGYDPVFHLKNLPSGGRAVSTLGSSVDLGAFLALLWPAVLRRLDAERKLLPAVLAACVAGGLIACGARGAMLAAAVGTAAYVLASRRDPAIALPRSIAIAAAAIAAALAWTFRSGASVSDQARREVWKAAASAFQQRPWLGWGPDGFEDAFKILRSDTFVSLLGSTRYQAYAHNDALHVLSGTGLLGAAAYGWLLVSLFFAAKRTLQRESRGRSSALFAGLLALWVNLALNPVALEVLVLAAVCAGLLVSLETGPQPPALARAPLAAVAVLAAVSLVYTAGLARADAAYKRGAKAQVSGNFPAARAEFSLARRVAPCEQAYITGELNAIGDWINATRDVSERLALLALADADARAALDCHPRQSTAHYVAGYSARMHADLGFADRLAEAAREYDRALELDPKFEPLRAARLETARRMSVAR